MSLKKKWTRLISGFLAVVMVVGLSPTFTIPATAADVPGKVYLANTGYDGDNMKYTSPGLQIFSNSKMEVSNPLVFVQPMVDTWAPAF